MEVIKIEKNKETKENKNKLKVAAYARVSTDHEEQQQSFESQQKYYFEKITRESNCTFAGIYADEGISGTQTLKRETS